MIGALLLALPQHEMSWAAFQDKLRGGWAGQMIGVSYGSVYEFQSCGAPILAPLREWKPEHLENAIQQDDLYVEMTFLKTLAAHGLDATWEQAGADFRDSRYPLWHANHAARVNLRAGIPAPQSGDREHNAHCDDIDFQIEADLFGLIAPGLPQAACALCDVFGRVMNYGDGLYGGRFVATMYTQAYLEPEPTPAAVRRCVEAGLAAIHPESAYAALLRDVLASFDAHPDDWLATWKAVEEQWGSRDSCPDGLDNPFNIDAKLNGAYIAMGLLYGGGDFARTLEITTRCGQDADCNPSNAAGVLGTIYGYSRIPAEYTSGIAALHGKKFSYTDYDFVALAVECERLARELLRREGGRVDESKGMLIIPEQAPRPPSQLEALGYSSEQIKAVEKEWALRVVPMERWSSGWKLITCGGAMDPGVRDCFGCKNVLVTHPVSRAEPAAFEKRELLPRNSPKLLLEVASHSDPPQADWELRVYVNGELLERRTIHSPGAFQRVELDLDRWAGQEVLLRLENAAGGAEDWAWEAAYWGQVQIL
ncbi:MAG: ADP-ribosylglycohydrolase family protein [Planctomycetota bacterium]|nr:MAG: ADP-ribosylglycohydrolase family protein [Planctomycetota bacterium]